VNLLEDLVDVGGEALNSLVASLLLLVSSSRGGCFSSLLGWCLSHGCSYFGGIEVTEGNLNGEP